MKVEDNNKYWKTKGKETGQFIWRRRKIDRAVVHVRLCRK